MAKSSKQKLAYQKEYNARPENVKKRELENQARAAAMKKGLVHKGDGLEVDHKTPLSQTTAGANDPKNLRAISGAANAGWRKGESDYKPQTVKVKKP